MTLKTSLLAFALAFIACMPAGRAVASDRTAEADAPRAQDLYSGVGVRAIHGDTFLMTTADGRRRLIWLWGVYTPTYGRLNSGWLLSIRAQRALNDLIAGRPVTCLVKLVSGKGIPVARCKSSGRDINRLMLEQGLAIEAEWNSRGTIAPHESTAAEARSGLWHAEPWRDFDFAQATEVPSSTPPKKPDYAGRAYAIGGAALKLRTDTGDDTLLWLWGVVAPATAKVWPLGAHARQVLNRLIAGRDLTCSKRGRSTRNVPLVRCWVDGKEINRQMIRSGFAIEAHWVSGNHYRADETLAARARRGLWALEPWASHDAKRLGDGAAWRHDWLAQLSGRAYALAGDTLKLTDASGKSREVWLWGVSTPRASSWVHGMFARAALDRLIDGKTVDCTFRAVAKDRTPIARCKAGGIELNRALIRSGFAVQQLARSNGAFDADEAHARRYKLGMWHARVDPKVSVEAIEAGLQREKPQKADLEGTAHVLSLETLELRQGGKAIGRIWLWGLDSRWGPYLPYRYNLVRFLRAWVEGQRVVCEKRPRPKITQVKPDHIWARCFLDGRDIARTLIRNGMAMARATIAGASYAGDVHYAQANRLGNWGLLAGLGRTHAASELKR